MSLKQVWCEGYKAFSRRTDLELRPVTVVFGRNNSGKTTLSRLPFCREESGEQSWLCALE